MKNKTFCDEVRALRDPKRQPGPAVSAREPFAYAKPVLDPKRKAAAQAQAARNESRGPLAVSEAREAARKASLPTRGPR